ncbi:MAG: hypothetical protein ACXABO_12250 [Promethearchaeota archaeon]
MTISLQDTVKEIIDRPYTLYYLYQLFVTGRENIPNFFDRIRIVKFLRKENLITSVSRSKKHLHKELNKITEDGVGVCEILMNNGYFEIFRNIPLNSKESFNTYFYKKVIELDQYTNYPDSIIYPIILGNISQRDGYIPSKIEIKIEKLILLELMEEKESWKIVYNLKCNHCYDSDIQDIDIIYNINDIDRSPKKITCSKCGTTYYIGPLLDYAYGV